jgi:cytochrome c-type biogenesis protein CcmF
MKFGMVCIVLALVATVISAFFYLQATTKKVDKKHKGKSTSDSNLKTARTAYYFAFVFIALAAVYLFYLILTHQFVVKYVYQYSSKDLSLGLLISTFWAGQEGSFLLWTLCTAIMGFILLRKGRSFEPSAMLFLNIIQAFFLILLIKASPFELLPQKPIDGSGLNPLLQNFWMVIHPPILFVGYAALTFPFVLALSALFNRQFDEWIKQALPWTIFSSLTLGAGIIIGAFWAYETLGWGGYWGWDPVENSSLIPWLTTLALLHGLIVQNRNGALRKSNFILAMLSFNLVIYATFLTRSGVLADFSVHSFTDLGINSLLIIFITTIFIFSVFVFLYRMKSIKKEAIKLSSLNRENALALSMWVFIASAFLIFIGTSSPIITGFFGNPSQVEISYYDKVNLPIGIFLALLLGITPFLLWVEKEIRNLPKRLLVPLSLSFGATLIIYFAGLRDPIKLLFVLTAFFATFSNIIFFWRQVRPNWINIAAPLAHFGVGIILIGIIVSANFSEKKQVLLTKGNTEEVLGFKMTYKGFVNKPDGKNLVMIEVDAGSKKYMALPRLYETKYSEGVMREPDVKPGLFSDIYISPLERKQGQSHEGMRVTLLKGEKKSILGYEVTFKGFLMQNHQGGEGFRVGAELEFLKEETKYNITPAILMGETGRKLIPATLPVLQKDQKESVHKHASVFLTNVNADEKKIDLLVQGLENEETQMLVGTEQLLIEVNKKPFMSILWIGTILLILGTFIS